MLLSLLLSTAMITAFDKAQLQSSKLSPNSDDSIAQIAGTRGVVLAKASFATYSGPGGPFTVLSYLIPANTLQIGDCFRWQFGGWGNNSDAAPRNFNGGILISQAGATSTALGPPVSVPIAAANSNFEWESDGMVCVGIAGANGQYLAGGGQLGTGTYTTNPRANAKLPNSALAITGYAKTLITASAVGSLAGGALLAASAGQSGTAQVLYSANTPILINLVVGSLGTSNTSLTVAAGVIEGL
jgi:hypothetical protein